LTPAPRLWRASVRYSVPEPRLALRLGSHSSPGYLWNASRIRNKAVRPFTAPILDPADNPSRLVKTDDDSDVSSSPTHPQLCSTGFAVGFCVTAFHSRFHGLRISRYRGECASPLHLRDRNFTSTMLKLSKTSWSSSSILDCESHFGGTDRTYSFLKAIIGFSLAARRAGM
jgi:hypothetical protein